MEICKGFVGLYNDIALKTYRILIQNQEVAIYADWHPQNNLLNVRTNHII